MKSLKLFKIIGVFSVIIGCFLFIDSLFYLTDRENIIANISNFAMKLKVGLTKNDIRNLRLNFLIQHIYEFLWGLLLVISGIGIFMLKGWSWYLLNIIFLGGYLHIIYTIFKTSIRGDYSSALIRFFLLIIFGMFNLLFYSKGKQLRVKC